MKWLKGVAATLVVTLLTTLLVAALQRPISDAFAPGRLSATVEIGPWFPLSGEEDPVQAALKSGITPGAMASLTSEDYPVARVTLENHGSKDVKKIQLRVAGITDPYIAIPKQGSIPYQFLGRTEAIKIPDMAPGERIVFYMWSTTGFGWPFYLKEWKTYSSEGAWRMEMKSSKTIEEEVQFSSLERFLVNWLDTIMFLLVVALLLVSVTGLVIQYVYSRDLLSDGRFYEAERLRYTADPGTFKIQLSGLGDFVSHFARERRRAKIGKESGATTNASASDKSEPPTAPPPPL